MNGSCLAARGTASSCRATDAFAVVTTFRRDQVAFCNVGSQTVDGIVDVGEAPWGVAWQPGGARVFVTNRESHSVSVIDTATRAVVGTVDVGQQPLGIAVHPFQPRAYATNYADDTVSVIDTTTLTVVDRIRVGNGPAGVAVQPAGAELYVTNYIEGSLSVVDVATGAVTATVKTAALPVGVAVHPSGAKIYVACSKERTLSVIGTVSHTVLDTVRVGRQPIGVAFNPDGSRAYVTNSADATVTIVNATIDRAIGKMPVGKFPLGVDVTATGSIWVAAGGADGITIEDADGGQQSLLAVPGTPVAIGDFIGFAPDTCPTAPPRCDDGNPYTGDACLTGLGCDRTPITGVEGVRTGVDAVGEIAESPANEDDPLVAEIRAALPALEAAVSAAQTDGSVAALRQVRRSLAPVLRVLERARRQDALGTVGAHLLDIVREARRQLKRLARNG